MFPASSALGLVVLARSVFFIFWVVGSGARCKGRERRERETRGGEKAEREKPDLEVEVA